MSCPYIIQGPKVIFPSGKEIEFKYSIRSSVLEYEGILILSLDVPPQGDWLLDKQSDDFIRNVFGLDIKNERVLWQIEPNEALRGQYSGPQEGRSDPNDIFSWGAVNNIEVNPYNGKIVKLVKHESQWD